MVINLRAIKRNWLLWLVFVVGIIAMVYWLRADSTESAAPITSKVVRGNIENFISASGTLEPKHFVEVGAQVSGQLQEIAVEEGDLVKAGDLLAVIDATVFETKVQMAAASLEGKRAQLQQLQAELKLAALRAKRNKNLHAQKAVSDDLLIESETNEQILQARINAMQAQIKADAAALAGDQATLNYSRIVAPIDGTVVSVSVREGQTLNASQNAPVLLKIADLTVMTLRADVSEADVSRIQPGMTVYFTTFGSGEHRWRSTLRQILPTPTILNDVVLYQALIDIENDDGRLRDAMTAQVFFVLAEAKDALLVPLGALHHQDGKPFVKVQQDRIWRDTPVQLGVKNRTHAEILTGLKEGDVVQVGIARARTGGADGGSRFGGRRGF